MDDALNTHGKYLSVHDDGAVSRISDDGSAPFVPVDEDPDDERFMQLALEQARQAGTLGEVPIGAVVVRDGKVVACGYNRREIDRSPTAHAEHIAIEEAAAALGRWRLSDCAVYVTLEPCVMCAGLMHQARIARCVYGAPDPKAGALGTLYAINADERLNHTFAVTPGVCEAECADLLRTFFAELRSRRRNR